MLIGNIGAVIAARRASRTPTARDYVQSGLIAMWDGSNNAGWGMHSANSPVWRNLIDSGADLVLESSKTSWGTDCLVCTGGEEDRTSQKCAVLDKVYDSAKTIEVVLQLKSKWSGHSSAANSYKANQTIVRVGHTGTSSSSRGYEITCPLVDGFAYKTIGLSLATDGYTLGVVDFEQYFGQKVSLNTLCRDDVGYINGTRVTPYTGIARVADHGTQTSVGCISGEVYSIRIYDRALTAAEVAHNYKIDVARFGLPKPWKNPYITDGLVAMWDGEWNVGGGLPHDPAAAVWKDICGNYDATFNGDMANAVWDDKFVTVSGADLYFGTSTYIPCIAVDNVFTVEITAKGGQTGARTAVFGVPTSSVGGMEIVGHEWWSGMLVHSRYNCNPELKITFPGKTVDDVIHTVRTQGLVDGEFISICGEDEQKLSCTLRKNYNLNGAHVSICGARDGRNSPRSVYCARVYNRVLSAAEIAANYAVDKERFNLA